MKIVQIFARFFSLKLNANDKFLRKNYNNCMNYDFKNKKYKITENFLSNDILIIYIQYSIYGTITVNVSVAIFNMPCAQYYIAK